MTKNNTILIDVDGVLLLEDKAIDGASNAIDYLNQNKINYLIVTNMTRLSKQQLFERLQNAGLKIPIEKLFTPVIAVIDYVKTIKQNPKFFLIGPEALAGEFKTAGISITREEEPVDFVVIGFDPETNYSMLNKAFHLIKEGTPFIGLHTYRQHASKDKPVMSIGCFVKGLEYCTKKKAMVIGKPSKNFFKLAMQVTKSTKQKTVMVGDDLEGDILCAKEAGLKTIMVKTGSYNEKDVKKSKQKPEYVIESIKGLLELFKITK